MNKSTIIDAGLRLWSRGVEPTQSAIAREIGTTPQHICYYFNGSYRLREALIYSAIQQGESRVIVQLIGSGHAAVKNMPEAERLDHLRACG